MAISIPLTDAEWSALREQRAQEGRCIGCGSCDGTHAPDCHRALWVTTSAVREHYGFDPSGHDEPGHLQPIHSKLTARGVRVWFLEDVETVAPHVTHAPDPQAAAETQLRAEIMERLDASRIARDSKSTDWKRRHG